MSARPMSEERAVARFCLRVMLWIGLVLGGLIFWLGWNWWLLYLAASVVLSTVRTIQDLKRIEEK